MKFKKDPQDAEVRHIVLVDDEADSMEVTVWSECTYKLIFSVNGEAMGLKRAKALKLAWAIIDELNP